jgi:hypothetical protein
VGIQTYAQQRRGIDPGPPASEEEVARLLASSRPFTVAAIGGAGLLAIIWLMIFKPF